MLYKNMPRRMQAVLVPRKATINVNNLSCTKWIVFLSINQLCQLCLSAKVVQWLISLFHGTLYACAVKEFPRTRCCCKYFNFLWSGTGTESITYCCNLETNWLKFCQNSTISLVQKKQGPAGQRCVHGHIKHMKHMKHIKHIYSGC